VGRLIGKLLPHRGPQRRMTAATFVNSYGGGMFITSSALYFTVVLGFSAAEVAFGLFLGATLGLVAGVFVGRLADRLGARETHVSVMFCGAAAMAGNLAVRSYLQYDLVCVAIGLVYAADKASKAPMIRAFGGDAPGEYRAYLRSVINLALALGALTAGVGMGVGTPTAYRCLIAARVAAFLGCGLIESGLPRVVTPRSQLEDRWAAFRDRPYLTATVLNSLMSVHMALPTFLLPLWIAQDTTAPRWTVSGLLVINTGLIVLLQVPASRGVEGHRAAGRRMFWAGAALLVGFGLMGLAAGAGTTAATTLLACGIAAYTVGEIWHAAASMEWSFSLAPPHALGQYSGVFGLGGGAAEAAGPAVLGAAVLGHGRVGWLVLGLALLAVGAVSPVLVGWASRSQERRVASAPPQSVDSARTVGAAG
jgi:hypothetical protein